MAFQQLRTYICSAGVNKYITRKGLTNVRSALFNNECNLVVRQGRSEARERPKTITR